MTLVIRFVLENFEPSGFILVWFYRVAEISANWRAVGTQV
jgi:hypothetical protein